MSLRSKAMLCLLAIGAGASAIAAQGWIAPTPCIVPLTRGPGAVPGPCRPVVPNVVRTHSDTRAELVGNGATDGGRVLRYEVDERFENRGGALGEADYLLPLPNGAAFQDLQLSIDGEMVAGETMGAAEARGIYEETVRRRRDPALVEWMGSALLRARIFPFNPGEEKRVVVRFQAVARREGDAIRVDAPHTASFELGFIPSPSLGTPYSPTHELTTSDSAGKRWVTARGEARDLTILIPVRPPSAPAISVTAYAPGGEDGFALITVAPPETRASQAVPRDVTFVLDVSGSMSGRKMEQARAAGRQLLSTLRADDRFRMIDFSTDVRTFRDDFVPATRENLAAAGRYLEELEAQGSTNIEGALRAVLETRDPELGTRKRSDQSPVPAPQSPSSRLSLVLFITDGEPTVGERNADALVTLAKHERRDSRIFTFGLGSDVNASLLEQLALDGGGTAQFVRPDESVERMVAVVASRLVDPVLTNVRIRVEGERGAESDVRLSKMLPMQPLDLFAGQDLVLFARYAGGGHGGARVVVEGEHGGAVVRWTSAATFPDRQRENAFVARLWAAQRIGWLSAERRKAVGPTDELDGEIRSLGDRFGIPTELTSYLVQEPCATAGGQRVPPCAVALHGMPMGAMGGGMGGMRPPAPQPAMSFIAAKAASEQRAATSTAALDAVNAAWSGKAVTGAASPTPNVSNGSRTPDGAATRLVDGRTFVLEGGEWVDARWRAQTLRGAAAPVPVVHVQEYSKAYFDLAQRLPELRSVFALGPRVLAMGRAVAIRVVAASDAESSAPELAKAVAAW